MENIDVEKSKVFIIVKIIEYIPNAVVIKTLIKKTTGNVTAVSVDSGENLRDKIYTFDRFIQIIEGSAEIMIENDLQILNWPAHHHSGPFQKISFN